MTISPETTHAVEPLLPDGRIDYYGAVNRENSKGIVPENNLVVGLFRLVPGEMELSLLREAGNPEKLAKMDEPRTFREKYWKELGFDAPPPLEKLEPLDSGRNRPGWNVRQELSSVYTAEQIAAKGEALKECERRDRKRFLDLGLIDRERYEAKMKEIDEETSDRTDRRIAIDEQNEAMGKVWTEKDFPYLARWIPSTDELTRKLIDVSRRTDYYSPVVQMDDDANLYGATIPYTSTAPHVSRFLRYRGNWDFGRGDFEQALECAFASIRMGRTIRKDAMFSLEDCLGADVEKNGDCQVTVCLADFRNTKDSAWLLEKKKEFDAIDSATGPLPVPPRWLLGERYAMLSIVQSLAFDHTGFVEFLKGNDEGNAAEPSQTFAKIYDPEHDYDWGKIFRAANVYHDEYEDYLTLPTYRRQLRATERLERRTNDLRRKLLDHTGAQGDQEERLIDFFAGTFLPPVNAVILARRRTEWVHRITSLAFALAAYRADHEGRNPDSLDRLVPKYVNAVPLSPFTDKPMCYVKRAKDRLIVGGDVLRLDGSETDVEKMIAEEVSGGWVFPDRWHSVFIVEKTE